MALRPHLQHRGQRRKIIQRVLCVGSARSPTAQRDSLNYIRTFRAQATVVDTSAPAGRDPAGQPVHPGRVGRGNAAGELRGGWTTLGCGWCGRWWRGYAYGGMHRGHATTPADPLCQRPGRRSLSTRRTLDEGTSALVLQGEDAAGNLGNSLPAHRSRSTTLRRAPSPSAIEGGDGWRNRNEFGLSWTNPVESRPRTNRRSALPLARRTGVDVRERRPGDLDTLTASHVPLPGEWQLRVWLEDAAGNQEPANASVPVTLRYDPEPPDIGFETPRRRDPTLVSAPSMTRSPALASGQIEFSAQGSGVWQTLQTRQEGNHWSRDR